MTRIAARLARLERARAPGRLFIIHESSDKAAEFCAEHLRQTGQMLPGDRFLNVGPMDGHDGMPWVFASPLTHEQRVRKFAAEDALNVRGGRHEIKQDRNPRDQT